MNKPSCFNCIYYLHGKQECRYHPPIVGEHGLAKWPIMIGTDDWCSKFTHEIGARAYGERLV